MASNFFAIGPSKCKLCRKQEISSENNKLLKPKENDKSQENDKLVKSKDQKIDQKSFYLMI